MVVVVKSAGVWWLWLLRLGVGQWSPGLCSVWEYHRDGPVLVGIFSDQRNKQKIISQRQLVNSQLSPRVTTRSYDGPVGWYLLRTISNNDSDNTHRDSVDLDTNSYSAPMLELGTESRKIQCTQYNHHIVTIILLLLMGFDNFAKIQLDLVKYFNMSWQARHNQLKCSTSFLLRIWHDVTWHRKSLEKLHLEVYFVIFMSYCYYQKFDQKENLLRCYDNKNR